VRIYLYLAASALIAFLGGVGGHALGKAQENGRVADCAAGIRSADYGQCPQPIEDAFGSLQLEAAEATIEYRDRTIPVFINDGAEDAALMLRLQADLAALAQEPQTNACATSPAAERRRLQLCAAYGGPDCPDADQGAG
jgi:hypothetical protein